MRLSRRRSPCTLLQLLGIALCGVGGAAVADPPAAAMFGALPAQTNPVLSPDGHWLAWIVPQEPRAQVIIFDLETRKLQRTVSLPERSSLRTLRWSDSQTLVMTFPYADAYRILALDVSADATRELASTPSYLISTGISKPAIVITASHSLGEKDPSRLYEVDTRSGKATVIRKGEPHTISWVVDQDGNPVAREDWDWWKRQYRVYALAASAEKEILRRDDSEQPPLVGGVLPGGSALLLLSTNGRSHQAAWALPLDGSPLQLLAEEAGADVTNVYIDPYSHAVIGVYVDGAQASAHWLDPAAKARYESLAHAFPGRAVEPYSWTQDGKRTLARVSSASTPPIFYLVDFNTHRADIAAEEYPALAAVTLAEVKETTYKARDGTDIPAYLTLPPGKAAPSLPLVVLPHGGPHARDYPAFDPLVQFLATRGYAVLQPEFRGSTGFGDAWRDAGELQWGRLMQDDLTDGVRSMVAQGIADAHRVCIVGLSAYSGYAALAGAAFTPELYACAVSINGITDLGALVKEMDVQAADHVVSVAQSLAKRELGGYFAAKHVSPINAVSAVTASVLIMYGANPSVSITHSQAMARALAKAGKDVSVVTLPLDAPWQTRTPTRVGVFQELERFLGAHLKPH